MTFADVVERGILPIVDGLIVPLLYALAFIFFLIGIVRLLFSQSETERSKGRDFALWSVIGFAVIFSVWGLVRVLLSIIA
ncbi:MAG TPA: hypothetical protein VEB18_02890 [Candidatus Paceibacterota bacterium]|nr:hypothetical protein [Candidatus Paceibacterota bacterium]